MDLDAIKKRGAYEAAKAKMMIACFVPGVNPDKLKYVFAEQGEFFDQDGNHISEACAVKHFEKTGDKYQLVLIAIRRWAKDMAKFYESRRIK